MTKKYDEIIKIIAKKLELSKRDVKEQLKNLYLKEREVLIKRLCYGLSLVECGKLFEGVTGERIRQIEKEAKKRLIYLINNDGQKK